MADLPPQLRSTVRLRDNGQCASCGIAISQGWYSVQHRKARGVGGTNDLSNLVLLCGSATSPGCHRKCEDRDLDMRERGFWIPSWGGEPAEIPIVTWDGRVVYIAGDGTWSFTAPKILTTAKGKTETIVLAVQGSHEDQLGNGEEHVEEEDPEG
jgi:hypothetical protein